MSALWFDEFDSAPPTRTTPAPAAQSEDCPFDAKYDGVSLGTGFSAREFPPRSVCFRGTRFDVTGQPHSCACEIIRYSIAALPQELRAPHAPEHAECLRANNEALTGSIRTRTSVGDASRLAKLFHLRHRFQSPSDVAIVSDYDLVKWETETWGAKDEDVVTFDDRCDAPRLLVIVLGELRDRDPTKRAPLFVRDAIRLRRNRNKPTWVVLPDAKPWIMTLPDSADLMKVIGELPEVALPRTHASPAPAPQVSSAPAKAPPPPTALKQDVAKAPFVCAVCGEKEKAGAPFYWANAAYPERFAFEEKKRIHVACRK